MRGFKGTGIEIPSAEGDLTYTAAVEKTTDSMSRGVFFHDPVVDKIANSVSRGAFIRDLCPDDKFRASISD